MAENTIGAMRGGADGTLARGSAGESGHVLLAAARQLPAQGERELRELIAGLPGVVFRCGLQAGGAVDFMSEQVVRLCGYRQDDFVGHGSERLLALVHPDDRRRVMTALRRAVRDGRPVAIEHRIVAVDGEEKWLWHRGAVRSERRGLPELESFVVDITDRKYEEQQLAYMASHDPLTGLANRSTFAEQIARCVQRANRHGGMVACLFLDLDRFKRVNDSFGHAFGDELLQQAAIRLRRCVRGNDVIGRLGGDEFTVLLDGINAPADAAAAARKILDELGRPFVIRGRRIVTAGSIGISCFPGDARDAAALLRNADVAMYHVKSSGRRGFRFFSNEMSSRANETLAMTSALRHALDGGGITLAYQPRIDLRSGRVVAFEALARWPSMEFGRVSPRRFIALAEDAGLIDRLGEHVLRTACTDAMRWRSSGARMSVNISARQFEDEYLAERIAGVLAETGMEPARLELEITERVILRDQAATVDMLGRLKALGVRLSVDDFGAGGSSLHLLRKLPLDFLKIDRSFLGGVPDDDDHVAITEAAVAMARKLNLGVVAEGIETEAQGVFARASGCDEGQGYLFSRPLRRENAGRFLEGRQP